MCCVSAVCETGVRRGGRTVSCEIRDVRGGVISIFTRAGRFGPAFARFGKIMICV